MDQFRSTTPFAETEILLAVLNDDVDHAQELLADMTDGELKSFVAKLQHAEALVRCEQGDRR